MKRLLPLLFLLPAACLSIDLDELAKDPPEKLRYLLQVPVEDATTEVSHADATLVVEHVHATSPYNGRPFVYRTGENRFAADYYHEFLVSPGQQLTELTRHWLRARRVFADVVEPGSALVATRSLELDLVGLYGDYRGETVTAHLVARASLFARDSEGGTPRILTQKRYAISAPVADRTPDALAGGFSEVVRRFLDALAKDLAR